MTARNCGVIAPGKHWILDSLRGAPPPGEALVCCRTRGFLTRSRMPPPEGGGIHIAYGQDDRVGAALAAALPAHRDGEWDDRKGRPYA